MPSAQAPDLFGATAALLDGLAYEPGFLSREEEAALLAAIQSLELKEAAYREYTAKRRIASFGFEYDFSSQVLNPAFAIPAFLSPLREKAARWLGLSPSAFAQALVTEYRAGTQLGWHRDTPEFGLIVGVSLHGMARMRFRRYPPRKGAKTFVLDLEPRSAYVLRGDARWQWQHGIAPTPGLRYSITLRTLRGGER